MALEMFKPLTTVFDGYFFFHGLRGALLNQLNRIEDARNAFRCAIDCANFHRRGQSHSA